MSVCSPKEFILLSTEKGVTKDYFYTDEQVILKWWQDKDANNSILTYRIALEQRALGSKDNFTPYRQQAERYDPYTSINLKQEMQPVPCFDYQTTLSVQDNYGLWAHTSRVFSYHDKLNCPRTMIPKDPGFFPGG